MPLTLSQWFAQLRQVRLLELLVDVRQNGVAVGQLKEEGEGEGEGGGGEGGGGEGGGDVKCSVSTKPPDECK